MHDTLLTGCVKTENQQKAAFCNKC